MKNENKTSVLYLDDDPVNTSVFNDQVDKNFNFEYANSIDDFNQYLNQKNFDVILLNAKRSDLFLQTKATHKSALFFILADQFDSQFRHKLYSEGIDDLILNPISLPELQVIIANRLNKLRTINLLEWHQFEVDLESISISYKNMALPLTKFEFIILHELIKAKGEIVFKKILSYKIWKNIAVSQKTLDTHISNLRNKLTEYQVQIACSRGQGYFLVGSHNEDYIPE